METEEEDEIKDTTKFQMFFVGENGNVDHSETIKLRPAGMRGSVEDVGRVSSKKMARSHSLGTVRTSENEVISKISFTMYRVICPTLQIHKI